MEESLSESFEGCAVIFHNVKEYYPTSQAISCIFSLKHDCRIEEPGNCYVGLFHVGWENLESCIKKICFSQIQTNGKNGLYTQEFSPSEIPKHNIDEFYQFCFYNKNTEVVLGASCPFQIYDLVQTESFIKVGSSNTHHDPDDWWLPNENPTSEDLEDSVLIHNKTTMLEDILAQQAEKNEAEFSKFVMEKKEFEQKTEEKISDLNDKIYFLEKKEKLLQQNLTESDDIIEHLTHKLEEVKDNLSREYGETINQLRNRIDNITQDHESILNEKEILISKLNEMVQASEDKLSKEQQEKLKLGTELEAMQELLTQEKDAYSQLDSSYNDMVKSFQAEIESLGKDQSIFNSLQEKIKQVEDNLTIEKAKNRCLIDETDKLAFQMEQLQCENKEKECIYYADMKEKMTELKEQSELVETLKMEKDDLINKLTDIENAMAKITKEHDVVVVELQDRLATVKAQWDNDKEVHANEISALQVVINSKIEQINNMETEQKESAPSVERKEVDVEELENQISLKSSSSHVSSLDSKGSSMDAGSRHALQIAYTHAKKQIKRLQKEKDHYQKLHAQVTQNSSVPEDIKELKRLNEEMKLRLCMGKTAFQEKYLECQKLKAKLMQLKSGTVKMDKSCGMDTMKADVTDIVEVDPKMGLEQKVKDLEAVNEKLVKNYSDAQKELRGMKEKEQIFMIEMENLKRKSKKLAENYEEKLQLVEEENKAIKKHKDALLRGELTAVPVRQNIVEKQPTSENEIVIYHPPSTRAEVVDKEPKFDGILYPPSFNHPVNRNPNVMPNSTKHEESHMEPVTQIMPRPGSNESAPRRETNESTRTQVIPRREGNESARKQSPKHLLSRGKTEVQLEKNSPCPVCGLPFPSNLSTTAMHAHVNNHFQDD